MKSLTPSKRAQPDRRPVKPNLSHTDRLEIIAADLTDAFGRALDGNDDGEPGGNFGATFGKSGVNIDAVALARVVRGRPSVASGAGSGDPRTTSEHRTARRRRSQT